jgi:hypothetical protein
VSAGGRGRILRSNWLLPRVSLGPAVDARKTTASTSIFGSKASKKCQAYCIRTVIKPCNTCCIWAAMCFFVPIPYTCVEPTALWADLCSSSTRLHQAWPRYCLEHIEASSPWLALPVGAPLVHERVGDNHWDLTAAVRVWFDADQRGNSRAQTSTD